MLIITGQFQHAMFRPYSGKVLPKDLSPHFLAAIFYSLLEDLAHRKISYPDIQPPIFSRKDSNHGHSPRRAFVGWFVLTMVMPEIHSP